MPLSEDALREIAQMNRMANKPLSEATIRELAQASGFGEDETIEAFDEIRNRGDDAPPFDFHTEPFKEF